MAIQFKPLHPIFAAEVSGRKRNELYDLALTFKTDPPQES